jgi:predicted ATP-grasp superfamily ATP-dependent carboligase
MGKNGGAVLSVNKQNITIRERMFEYQGSEIPLKHGLSQACARTALRAAKLINLLGYCGVDLVIGDIPYVVEVNPRLTTSFIALTRILGVNLGKLLVRALFDGVQPEIEIKKHSIVRIPKAKRDIRVGTGELDRLREIEGVVAPPFTPGGSWRKGTGMLITGVGSSPEDTEHEFTGTMEEVLSLLKVDRDAVAWS